MHKANHALLVLLLCTRVGAAESPQLPGVPPDVTIFRVQWVANSLLHTLCAKQFPENASLHLSAMDLYQRELRKAEATIREDAASRGAEGEEYLSTFIEQGEQGVGELFSEESIAKAPKPELEQCQLLLRVSPDRLFANAWRRFVRDMEPKGQKK